MTVSLAELLSQRDAIERQIKAEQVAKRQGAIFEIRKLMSDNGLTVEDLAAAPVGKSRASKSGAKKVAPKYRDPESGQTWTGRGLKPRWLAAAIADGKSAEDYAI